jgi:hypothetical protein
MRKAVALAFLLTCAAFAADTDFNGWWDITAPGSAPRAWWLGVQGAGSASPKVSFISDHGGDLNVADEVSFSNGELSAFSRARILSTFTLSTWSEWMGRESPALRKRKGPAGLQRNGLACARR